MNFDLERVNADMHHIDQNQDPETQRRILAVAEQLFLAKGFKGVSMKDIAEEVQSNTSRALLLLSTRQTRNIYECDQSINR